MGYNILEELALIADTPEIAPSAPAEQPEQIGPTFIDHLSELRNRIIACAVIFLVASAGTFCYSAPIIHLLQKLAPASTIFVQLSPGEVFMSSFKLSMITAVGAALPFFLYHIFAFIGPALETKEKRFIYPLLLLSVLLFAGGILFGYEVILPTMLGFFLEFGAEVARNQLGIATFVDFCTGFLVATGIVFELPLCLLFVSFTGLITSKSLLSQWRVALIASFILGAIITPTPDVFSQCLLSIPIFCLYGVSIILIRLFGR